MKYNTITILITFVTTCVGDMSQFYHTLQPVILEEIGVSLIPTKVLASGTSTLFQSIFLKVNVPTIPEMTCKRSCSPSDQALEKLANEKTCWSRKGFFDASSMKSTFKGISLKECLKSCLKTEGCEVISIDEDNCFLHTRNWLYVTSESDGTGGLMLGKYIEIRNEALPPEVSAAKMSCLLKETNMTKEEACFNSYNLFDILKNATESYKLKLWEEITTRIREVKRAYELNFTDVDTGRVKQNLDEDLESIPVIGYLYGILKSPLENKKLKKHLKKLEADFHQFAKQATQEINKMKEFDKQVLRLIETETTNIYGIINDLGCDVNALADINIYQLILHEHERKLNQLATSINNGKLLSDAVPILSAKDVRIILENPIYDNTVYRTIPELLLRVGELVLMDVLKTEEAFSFHYILATPKLAKKALYQTYTPRIVPMQPDLNGKHCLEVLLPELIFKANGIFYTADLSACTKKNEIYLCVQQITGTHSPSIEEVPCLNGDFDKCETKLTKCDPRIIFTKSGALVFSLAEILGQQRSQETVLTPLSRKDKYTYFFTWEQYVAIQTGYKIMHAVDYYLPPSIEKWGTHADYTNLLTKLKERFSFHERQNTTKLYESIQEFEPIFNDYLSEKILGTSPIQIITYASLAVTIITIVITIIALNIDNKI